MTVERGGRTVLESLTVTLDEPRIGIVGINGSGKSTFVRLLNGLVTPASGTVEVFGEPVDARGRAIAEDVGFIFQNPDHQILFPTVLEEVTFGITRGAKSNPSVEARARAFLEENDAGHLTDRAVHELSEGQRHLVAILSVLVGGPRLVVLDEPFASLDLPTQASLAARIRALPTHVIAISHDLALLEGFDRILWLDGGGIREDGPPGRVLPAYRTTALAARPAL